MQEQLLGSFPHGQGQLLAVHHKRGSKCICWLCMLGVMIVIF